MMTADCVQPNKQQQIKKIKGRAISVLAAMMSVGMTLPAMAQECDSTEMPVLLASDGSRFSAFGSSVAIDNNMAIVGRPGDDNGGSAYIFIRSDGVWVEQAKLIPDDGELGDRFGSSVSINGDTALVGASKDDDNGTDSGSAYIFTQVEGVWTQQAKLVSDDASESDQFGHAVSIDSDTALIAAPNYRNNQPNGFASGVAYVFTRTEGLWSQQARILPDDGAALNYFGESVSIHGDTALIGSDSDDDLGNNSGSAYIFTRSGGVWTQHSKLLPSDGAAENYFGGSVSISYDTAVVGAYGHNDNGNNAGAAYVFTLNEGSWTEQAKLLPDDGVEGDLFGVRVGISTNTVVASSVYDDDVALDSGSAYVFTRSEGIWSQQSKLVPTVGSGIRDWFGYSIAVSNDTAIVGSVFGSVKGKQGFGTAYIYDLGCFDCPADLTDDGSLNFLDVSEFLALFGNQDPIADFNNDGSFNFLDVSEFLAAFGAGCP